MKTLCLGGSFNPIHHGHLICARSVAESDGFDKILLIPSRQPPHKPQNELADASDRLTMCRLAIESANVVGSVSFEISDIEINRPGPSYTIDTVRQMQKLGMPQVYWLIGADMLNFLPKWHQPAALLREANFVIIERPGIAIEWNALPAEFIPLKKNLVQAPRIDISSSDIRRRIAMSHSIDYLTPPAVVAYINAHGLYRT
ncbi:MAG TPA: nicotinate-nucleotide adenylyltransferase [Tepidisphaeraceae bacterium]|nr:nicotinate-nucleotide adenylyltransferase [Tepidisphaeraceae bacterium]